jgi:hypothetical protein
MTYHLPRRDFLLGTLGALSLPLLGADCDDDKPVVAAEKSGDTEVTIKPVIGHSFCYPQARIVFDYDILQGEQGMMTAGLPGRCLTWAVAKNVELEITADGWELRLESMKGPRRSLGTMLDAIFNRPFPAAADSEQQSLSRAGFGMWITPWGMIEPDCDHFVVNAPVWRSLAVLSIPELPALPAEVSIVNAYDQMPLRFTGKVCHHYKPGELARLTNNKPPLATTPYAPYFEDLGHQYETLDYTKDGGKQTLYFRAKSLWPLLQAPDLDPAHQINFAWVTGDVKIDAYGRLVAKTEEAHRDMRAQTWDGYRLQNLFDRFWGIPTKWNT